MRINSIRLPKTFTDWCEKTAEEWRTRLGLAPDGRLHARVIAEEIGAKVFCPTKLKGLPLQYRKTLVAANSGFSAVTIQRDGQNWILHNTGHSIERQESDIFHEISHLLCGHKAPAIPLMSGFFRPDYSQELEDQAKWLGSCLHLPRVALASSAQSGLTSESVCKRYCASMPLLRWRLNMTKVRLLKESA